MGPRRILVVEDDGSITEVLGDLLRSEGYRVETAEDGQAGLSAILRQPPDLLLLDVMMPRMSGPELLVQLRALGLDRFPVVLMSAAPPPDHVALGAAAFVAKPFDLDEVVALVERLAGPALASAC
ncbi:response regulator transcription factor [Vulgatibacter sp.]|uniref:response regulator transcription factor n=1 Tax=Vulgatibacter sp. TaxID=1971226 RepID=UPI00356A7854